MSDSYHLLGFTRSFLEACTDLKLIELQEVLLREGLVPCTNDL